MNHTDRSATPFHTNHINRTRYDRCALAALLLLAAAVVTVGVCYAVMMWGRPWIHDDLNYGTATMGWVNTHHPAWLRFPTQMAGVWLSVNGRMGEMTTVLFYALWPRWVHVTLVGIMMSGMYAMTLIWTRRFGGRVLTASLTLAFLYWGMTWWDNFNLFIMHNNYVWGATLTLAALWLILCCPMQRRRGLWWMPVMFIIGEWHEAAGVPFACGLVLYLWLNRGRHPLNNINKWLMGAFTAGAAASILSPAILHRAAADNMPDERLWYMLLTSAWCVGILIIAIGVMAVYRRRTLSNLIRSTWVVFATAALAGLAVCAYSGSYGRTGWFAQISAWIALCGMLNAVTVTDRTNHRRELAGIIIAPVVAAGVIVCSIALTRYQLRLNRECRYIIEQYRENPDGVVFVDLTTPSQAPKYLMGRAWGWMGQYDNWHRYLIERTYSGVSRMKPLTLLPEELRSLNPTDTLRHQRIAGHTVTYPAIYDTTYNNAYNTLLPPRVFAFIGHDNRIYYRQKFIYRGAYGIIDSPADLAPGERYPNINLQFRALPEDSTRFYTLPTKIL